MSQSPLPQLPESLLVEHAQAHARLDIELTSVEPFVGRLISRQATRITIDAIANLRPSLFGPDGPPLFPTPRAFRSARDQARVAGIAAAFRHIDSRLTMVRTGHEPPPALRPETPYVLNALTEGRVDNPLEMNPGMIRSFEYKGNLPVAAHGAVIRRDCRQRLDQALAVAADPSVPAVVRAGWLLYEMGDIHPFADGNGRVARLLYLLVTGADMPRTVDWGVCEQLRGHDDGDWSLTLGDDDPTANVIRSTELSRDGAVMTTRRLSVLSAKVPELLGRLEVDDVVLAVIVAVWLQRSGRLDEIAADAGLDYAQTLDIASALCRAGALVQKPEEELVGWRAPTGVSDGNGAGIHYPFYVLSDQCRAQVNGIIGGPIDP